jgi:FkbM family methyltransferase
MAVAATPNPSPQVAPPIASKLAPPIAPLRARALGGPLAGLHLFCLRLIAFASRLAGGRGMQKCTWILARVFSPTHAAILETASGARLKIRLADGYWTRLLIPGYSYEPEIGATLARVLAQPDVFFLDCGANIGYWSVVLSRMLPAGRILAVEASPPNYAQLAENAALNEGKFQTVPAALWERDGEEAVIVSHELRHAGSSIVERRDKISVAGYTGYTVPTVTIDSLCDRYVPDPAAKLPAAKPHAAKIVIKLDVEGAEIPALHGARKVFAERQALLLYEEHGQDAECRVSAFVLNELGFTVFHCGQDARCTPMRSLEDIRRLKVDPHTGYNFVACAPGSAFAALF